MCSYIFSLPLMLHVKFQSVILKYQLWTRNMQGLSKNSGGWISDILWDWQDGRKAWALHSQLLCPPLLLTWTKTRHRRLSVNDRLPVSFRVGLTLITEGSKTDFFSFRENLLSCQLEILGRTNFHIFLYWGGGDPRPQWLSACHISLWNSSYVVMNWISLISGSVQSITDMKKVGTSSGEKTSVKLLSCICAHSYSKIHLHSSQSK